MSFYQPAVGIWRSSPERRVLWAAKQVLLRIERDIPEQRDVRRWANRLRRGIKEPVSDYDWESWYATTQPIVKGEKPEVPDEIVKAWSAFLVEGDEAAIVKLWKKAAQVRTEAEGLPFLEEEIAAGLKQTFHLVKGVPDTLKDALRNMMQLALDAHDTQFDFARAVRREWSQFSKVRSELIAVTEWNRAASQATLHAYKKMGVQRKVWYTVGDNRVCPTCEQNSVDGEIPINKEFYSGDDAPPAHPGCRCNISSA